MSYDETASGIWPDQSSNYDLLDPAFDPPSASPLGDAHLLTLRQLRSIINAEAFAAAQGWPLSAHVTIHLRLANGFTEAAWSEFHTELFDKAARWLKRRGVPVAFVWSRENGWVKGPHLHCLIHLPRQFWGGFKLALLHAGNFEVADAGGEAIIITGGQYGMLVPSMRAGALKYISKTADCGDRVMSALGITPRPGIPVRFKRVGASHTISRRARERAGWKEMDTLDELRAHLHPPSASAAATGGADVVLS